ncbi:MAG TPA: methyltransferase domain-containing protein [Solirubrobacteraceae bacterium]|nr:methyltransferase domain-containing protein [Solirubrobacteraceae bacterium]
MDPHADTVVEQFTAQARGYASAGEIRDGAALELLVECAAPGPEDRVLDVACGPGIVTCAFARAAREATGVDVTAAMLERAREHARELGVENVGWRLAEIPPLPWPDRSFEVVVSRYALHHLADPLAVVREMARVCAPGGRVVVCDLALPPAAVDAFNAMDSIRDPSHVRALTLAELVELYRDAGLAPPRIARYELAGELESLLARSFPAPGGADEVRRRFRESVASDGLGIAARLGDGGRISYRHPIAILAAGLA